MKQKIAYVFMLSYLWVTLIMLGAFALEVFMVYPNIFHDVPNSFEISMDFMKVASPHTFFPPLGLASWLTGLGALILSWEAKAARYWILGSIMVMILLGLISMVFEWPRNEIMFIEGNKVHSVAFLKQTAREFLVINWLRIACNTIGAVLVFKGFLMFFSIDCVKVNDTRRISDIVKHASWREPDSLGACSINCKPNRDLLKSPKNLSVGRKQSVFLRLILYFQALTLQATEVGNSLNKTITKIKFHYTDCKGIYFAFPLIFLSSQALTIANFTSYWIL